MPSFHSSLHRTQPSLAKDGPNRPSLHVVAVSVASFPFLLPIPPQTSAIGVGVGLDADCTQ